MYIILFLILFALAIQDFRQREISGLLIFILFIVSFSLNSYHFSIQSSLQNILFNGIFILVEFIGLTLYFSIRHGKLINPIDTFIGMGDLLFLIAVSALFSFQQYLLFFSISLFTALLLYFIPYIKLVWKEKKIPLAGVLAIFTILSICFFSLHDINYLN